MERTRIIYPRQKDANEAVNIGFEIYREEMESLIERLQKAIEEGNESRHLILNKKTNVISLQRNP